ncbi:MAG TPA: hypothetical protein VIL55_08640 [Naasia sp.]
MSGIGHQWTGAFGEVIDLTPDGPSSLRLTNDPPVEGLSWPEELEWVRTHTTRHGQRYLGGRIPARDAFFAVIAGTGPTDWLAARTRFVRSLRPGHVGTWRVTNQADGSYRELRARFTPGPALFAKDPSASGRELIRVPLVADDPWWRGPLITREFGQAETDVDFFADADSESPTAVLQLMSSFTAATAAISNPGDVPAWMVAHVRGPVDGFSVGVGSSVVAGAVEIPENRTLTVNFGERVVLWDDGTPVPYAALTAADFAAVPPGETVPLSVQMAGTGTVLVELSPCYFEAF